MINKYLIILIILLSNNFAITTYSNNSIFSISNNPRKNSMGNSHSLSKNINGIFTQPISLDENIEGNIFYSYSNYFNNMFDVMQFGYCLRHNENNNYSIGLIKRSISNNYNTNFAWNYDVDGPSFDEIDYSEISTFSDNEIGLLFSFTKRILVVSNSSFINIKLKPSFHSISSDKAYGFSSDFIFNTKIYNLNLNVGIENIFAYKKWSSQTEKYKLNSYLNAEINFNQLLFVCEYHNSRDFLFGLETKINDFILLRYGYNNVNKITYGFGIQTNFFELNYAYLKSENNFINYLDQYSLIFNINKIRKL